MRIILQVVKEGSVTLLRTNLCNKIDRGILLYVGFSEDSDYEKIIQAANKILKLKIFSKGTKNFKKSIKEIKGEILVISNFTLLGDCKKNKPEFIKAAKFNEAKEMYEKFVSELKKQYIEEKIKTGFFGEQMEVSAKAEGPLNFILDF